MQNKPNFLKDQMNVSLNTTMDYESISDWTLGENKPNQSQFQNPTNPSKEREEYRVSGTFSGSQLPERIYYCCLWEIPV